MEPIVNEFDDAPPRRGAWQRARRILAVRLDQLGDVMMTTPALAALKHGAAARSAAGLDVVEDVADHPRALEREIEIGGRAQQQAGFGLAAAATRAGSMHAGVDAGELDAVLGELCAHVGMQRVERRVVEQAQADTRLVRDHDERVAVGLQQHQAFDRLAREAHALRVGVVGNVLDQRAVAIDEDRRARGGGGGGDGRVHDTTSADS